MTPRKSEQGSLSVAEAARELGVDQRTVLAAAKRMGIVVRSYWLRRRLPAPRLVDLRGEIVRHLFSTREHVSLATPVPRGRARPSRLAAPVGPHS
jgi:hypothetical protein